MSSALPFQVLPCSARNGCRQSVAAFKSGLLRLPRRSCNRRASLQTVRAASDQDSKLTKAVVAAGFVANPVVLVSEYFLKTTGEGLPPGPGGIYGATEGVSYLVIVGVVAWSLYTKVKTGSGLQGSLLGAVEGLSYLSLVAGIVVAALVYAEKGSLPGITG
ncbi:Cysteine-rich secretory protein LCCL domain-containing 1 [Trebouxia sp. C0009 RCD-2024]